MIGLLRDARKASLDYNATVTLRLDPKTLKFQVDTATSAGTGTLAVGVARPGSDGDARQRPGRAAVHLPTDGRRVRRHAWSFTAAKRRCVVRVDPWSGVARVDQR